jgi:hypothetical protein
MEPNWAADNLQVIRTLMERSTIYRRALGPIMLAVGLLGIGASIIGWFGGLGTERVFILFWLAVSVIAVSVSFLLARKQALKEHEEFWSPPTRRITQAMLPPLFGGMVLGFFMLGPQADEVHSTWLLPPIWMILYGCALHAAGFFTPRGMKLFGWGFILSGAGLAAGILISDHRYPLFYAHAAMGFFFGGYHLAYGTYLHFTEPRKNET